MARTKPPQRCSIARTLNVVGDYWTLLVLREVFRGNRRFDGLQAATGASTNVLADRLSRLVEDEVLEKRAYQTAPERFEYRLTARGRDLFPVLVALMAWGDRWLAGPEGPPIRLRHRACGEITEPGIRCSRCGEVLAPDAVEIVPGEPPTDTR